MKKGNVVRLQYEKGTSFSWANGLYVIVENDGEFLGLSKLNEDLQPKMYDDGEYMLTHTGKSNTYLKLLLNVKIKLKK